MRCEVKLYVAGTVFYEDVYAKFWHFLKKLDFSKVSFDFKGFSSNTWIPGYTGIPLKSKEILWKNKINTENFGFDLCNLLNFVLKYSEKSPEHPGAWGNDELGDKSDYMDVLPPGQSYAGCISNQ